MTFSTDQSGTYSTLSTAAGDFGYFSLSELERMGAVSLAHLPYSIRVLLENALRNTHNESTFSSHVEQIAKWGTGRTSGKEFPFMPGRVVLQDFTGVPAIVDLAAMRDAITRAGQDPTLINPVVRSDLVIDHSVQVDYFASEHALNSNIELEFERNSERYQLLRWAQEAFENFRVVPPGTGIVHQVNLEYLASVVLIGDMGGTPIAFPDTCIGTDSHTTMVNALGVLGWGVGGIEAEAVMLGQPYYMLVPDVVGVRLNGALREGSTATDLVLVVTELLRSFGVVEKFVEFFGPGLSNLPLADRATISNMAPEYGATCGFFPIDQQTLNYLKLTGRTPGDVELVERYSKEQCLFYDPLIVEPAYSAIVEVDLTSVEPSLAGPKRPNDRVLLGSVAQNFMESYPINQGAKVGVVNPSLQEIDVEVNGLHGKISDGAVVIAAITSCTNTSNPSVMVGAGLLARNARAKGLGRKPWVKTSMAPGSKVVTSYLDRSTLTPELEALGFATVGYGCTTCIGNSGPLPQPVADVVSDNNLVVAAVLSGNRNFEGRIHPQVQANYLASPLLVVAYALVGRVDIDLIREPIGQDTNGCDVYLREIWPSQQEIADVIAESLDAEMFKERYSKVFDGGDEWRSIPIPAGVSYKWDSGSTYIQRVPFFDNFEPDPTPPGPIVRARVLVSLGDSVTTDHISPAGSIPISAPSGQYLIGNDVTRREFNSYGARRGNHDVMVRGTFGNIRLRNRLILGREGDWTVHFPSGDVLRVYDAAMRYGEEGTPLIVLAGSEYGTGSSRDWAAKGPMLLGVRAAIAKSFERIHRSNLIGMGILPLQFMDGEDADSLGLTGSESFDIPGAQGSVEPAQELIVTALTDDGSSKDFKVLARVDTDVEAAYYQHGGMLRYVLRNMMRTDPTG